MFCTTTTVVITPASLSVLDKIPDQLRHNVKILWRKKKLPSSKTPNISMREKAAWGPLPSGVISQALQHIPVKRKRELASANPCLSAEDSERVESWLCTGWSAASWVDESLSLDACIKDHPQGTICQTTEARTR